MVPGGTYHLSWIHPLFLTDLQTCQHFFLFEPICTAILLAATSGEESLIHLSILRSQLPPFHSCSCYSDTRYLWEKPRCSHWNGLSFCNSSRRYGDLLWILPLYVSSLTSCSDLLELMLSHVAVPLEVGQGCIAGPKHNWVGIYWVGPTLLYTASVSYILLWSKMWRTQSSLAVSSGFEPLHCLSSPQAFESLEVDASWWSQPVWRT